MKLEEIKWDNGKGLTTLSVNAVWQIKQLSKALIDLDGLNNTPHIANPHL